MAETSNQMPKIQQQEKHALADFPDRHSSQASIQPPQSFQSKTPSSDLHPGPGQLPISRPAESPRPRTSISISQLLIDHVPSPTQPSSALRSPSSIPLASYNSPTSIDYNLSPRQPRPQAHSPSPRRQHHLDRPPLQHESPFSFRDHQTLPWEGQPSLTKRVDSFAQTGHKFAASSVPSSFGSHHAYDIRSASGRTRRVRKTPNLDYVLNIRQQPIAARACGFGERDRRVIDPPPIIELKITDKEDGQPEDDPNAMLALHCTLLDHEGKDVASQVSSPQLDMAHSQRLMGSLVASPYRAKDEHGVAGTFFVFPDLSCRAPGKFRLHFNLLRVDPMNMLPGSVHGGVATITTDIFVVHVAKDFPGMRASSALLKSLRKQGLSVGVKKGSENRHQKSKTKREISSDDQDAGTASDGDGGESESDGLSVLQESRRNSDGTTPNIIDPLTACDVAAQKKYNPRQCNAAWSLSIERKSVVYSRPDCSALRCLPT
nr:sexual development regulator velc [Quercus suber]